MVLSLTKSCQIAVQHFGTHPLSQPFAKLQAVAKTQVEAAFWYYSSIFCKWWDFGGMSSFYTEIGGIHPTGDHPKPRPTTPRNLLIIMIFLYQSQNSYLHVESKS